MVTFVRKNAGIFAAAQLILASCVGSKAVVNTCTYFVNTAVLCVFDTIFTERV